MKIHPLNIAHESICEIAHGGTACTCGAGSGGLLPLPLILEFYEQQELKRGVAPAEAKKIARAKAEAAQQMMFGVKGGSR